MNFPKLQVITSKGVLNPLIHSCISAYDEKGVGSCVEQLQRLILSQKVKFPLLEYCGTLLYEKLALEEHIALCDQIEALKTEGGNVLLGIILQKRLTDHFRESIDKATVYTSKANIWYVCDIIGERVFGYSLITEPEKTLPHFQRLSNYPANWVIRSLGAGGHYGIKKGLSANYVAKLFEILLSTANTKDKEIRQGVGWAAKTTAKFHPEIIEDFESQIEDTSKVANWFRAKVKIGLQRHKYATRN